jgi:hypothetical protein
MKYHECRVEQKHMIESSTMMMSASASLGRAQSRKIPDEFLFQYIRPPIIRVDAKVLRLLRMSRLGQSYGSDYLFDVRSVHQE